MCLGGGSMGRSAEDFYQEIRKTPDPLPSLPTDMSNAIARNQRKGMKNVRTGTPPRTLLNITGSTNG